MIFWNGDHLLWDGHPARALFVLCICLIGCRKSDMAEQPRYRTYQQSDMFADGASARPLVAGTVPRGESRTDELLYAGTIHGLVADQFPFSITRNDLLRGRQQFDIFCAACHGRTGEGNGMIAQRGFTPPPSYHLDRLRNAPAGHFFQVISNGQGAMYGYSERIVPEDRWRITAYVRALQLSQNAAPSLLDEKQRAQADHAAVVPPTELSGYPGPRGKVGVDQ